MKTGPAAFIVDTACMLPPPPPRRFDMRLGWWIEGLTFWAPLMGRFSVVRHLLSVVRHLLAMGPMNFPLGQWGVNRGLQSSGVWEQGSIDKDHYFHWC